MKMNNNEILNVLEMSRRYVELSLYCKDYNITLIEWENKGYKVDKNNNDITITYNKKNQIFQALLYIEVNNVDSYEYSSNCIFNDLGIMLDCARNGVLNIEYIKKTIVQLALIGYDSLQLYLEDCIEIIEEKNFGNMRGSYSKEQLKEIDQFALKFGIELVPCVQTLAHLNQIFRWSEYQEIKDIDDILLIDNEKTHELIENIIKTTRECFSSNRINVNMDEAHNLGRGKYLDRNGYHDVYDLFIKHKNLVVNICKKYNYQPMMWSDMFFRNVNNHIYYVNDEQLDFKGLKVNDIGLIYWDYYHLKENSYNKMIKYHQTLSDNIIFAGGIWLWRGLVPYIKYTESTMLPALSACKKNNIKEAFFTVWGDDGNESLRGNCIGSYIFLAEHSKMEKINTSLINKKCKVLTGYSYNEWVKLDSPNFLDFHDAKKYNVNPSKYLLYMDPLLSVYDSLIYPEYNDFYNNLSIKLHKLSKRNSPYSYLFELESKLCKVLSHKATLSLSIKEAYDNKNMDAIKDCLSEVKLSIEAITEFHNYYRICWKKENKATGFEIQDIRLGGLVARLSYIKDLLEEYICKNGIVIEELELERKEFVCGYKTKNGETLITNYQIIVSTNRLSW